MFIMAPWNKTISYGETMRAEMRSREGAIKNFFQNVDVALREAGKDEASTSGKWQVRAMAMGLGGVGVGMVVATLRMGLWW